METAVFAGLSGLVAGFASLTIQQAAMIAIGCALLYLGISRGLEPLLLLPIGFGAIIVNIPNSGLMAPGGVLRTIYVGVVLTALFTILMFICVVYITDFGL